MTGQGQTERAALRREPLTWTGLDTNEAGTTFQWEGRAPFTRIIVDPAARAYIMGLQRDVDALEAENRTLRELVGGGIEAFRLTREYVGDAVLPPVPGWSWYYDWCQRARAALSEPSNGEAG